MAMRMLRAGVGLLLIASGALMYGASWQRWAGFCPWGVLDSAPCNVRQDHRYDFVMPSAPWEPVGDAAQQAGASLLVLALAFVLMPWALTGRRPGVVSALALASSVAATAVVGLVTWRSGLSGSVIDPPAADLLFFVWLLVPPALLVRWAFAARGGSLAAAVLLLLATPLVAAFTYAIGPYDAMPWHEGISGSLTAAGGLCLLAATTFHGRSGKRENGVAGAAPSRAVSA